MILCFLHACKLVTALTWLRMQLRYVQGLQLLSVPSDTLFALPLVSDLSDMLCASGLCQLDCSATVKAALHSYA